MSKISDWVLDKQDEMKKLKRAREKYKMSQVETVNRLYDLEIATEEEKAYEAILGIEERAYKELIELEKKLQKDE